MGQCVFLKRAMVCAVLGLAGCMGDTGGSVVSRFKSNLDGIKPLKGTAEQREQAIVQNQNADSEIIQSLLARSSVIPTASSYDKVAASVLAANSRAAESELRAARLRAHAQSKNWLPKLGPSISLSSLSDIVASILIEQVIFDNGRKKAERDFAKADVEYAAVALAQDTNERVYTALDLYVQSQKAREKATLAQSALKDMDRFEWVMNERVKGGVSDMSDLNVIRQKVLEQRSLYNAQQEAANAAIAELNAMSAEGLGDVRGLTSLSVNRGQAKPLSVALAEAETERLVAQAEIERAALLPGVKATATVSDSGTDIGVSAAADNLFGAGTGANLKALNAVRDAAKRREAQAQEDSNRVMARLEQRAASMQRQSEEAKTLTAQAKQNLDLFQAQYQAGQRQVMDVVGVYETYARQQQEGADLKYNAALVRLEMAKELGLLVDGGDI